MATTSNDATSAKKNKKATKIKDPSVEAFQSMQDAVRNELINCKPGDELETLLRTLQHNVHPQPVKDDILAAFQRHYSGVFNDDQVHVFGSTVMGIMLKDSDLDFYVELPNCEYVLSIKAAKKIRIEMVKRILEASQKFALFQMRTKPRIPIIRCVHIATLINCDFNCNNSFGTLNSPIIEHLLNFDPRIRKLAIIIKYWMKIHRCSGKNRISNYASIWMLIFYLQTLSQPIVPPIIEFQLNVPASMCSYYNFAFDYSIPNRTENRSPLPELLLGFFKFYRDFDYVSKLICPLYGKTLFKKDVAQKKDLVELQRYKQTLRDNRHTEHPMWLDQHSMCIQDPFEILRKVPGEISVKDHEDIVQKICYAAEIIECELQKGDTKSLFSQIFKVAEFEQYAIEKAKAKEQLMIEQERYGYLSITSVYAKDVEKMTLRMKPTNFILKMAKWTILANNSTAPTDERSVKKRWTKEVIAMVIDIFDKIFHLDLNDPDDDDDDDDDYGEDVGGEDEFLKTFELIGARNVFIGRQKQWICEKRWNYEVLDSLRRFNCNTTAEIPFKLFATIVADIENFDYISFQFSDQIRTRKYNFFKTFCNEFVNRIDYFLQVYFVRRNHSNDRLLSL